VSQLPGQPLGAPKRSRKLPQLQRLKTKDPELSRFGATLQELINVWQGNKEYGSKVVTMDDLVGVGLVQFQGNTTTPGGASSAPSIVLVDDPVEDVVDLTPPAQPSNVVVTGSMSSIFLTWTANVDNVTAYYEVWRNTADTFDGNETLQGTAVAPVYTDAVGDTNLTYYYWVRAVSSAEIEGPFNVTTGDAGATGAVALTNFASGLTAVEILDELPVSGNFEGRTVLLTTTGTVWRYNADDWTDAVDGGAITANSIVTGAISTGAIQAEQIDTDAVTADKVAAGAIAADHITVDNLAAIQANLGAITAGSLNINSRFVVDSNGNVTLSSASSGARLVIQNSVIKVYDADDNLRVQMGDLTA
jgi:hypothetical protein